MPVQIDSNTRLLACEAQNVFARVRVPVWQMSAQYCQQRYVCALPTLEAASGLCDDFNASADQLQNSAFGL